MKRPSKWLVILAAVIVIGAVYWYSSNHLSKDEIAATITASLQQKLDSTEFSEYKLKVEKVDVLHEVGNKYKGLATVSMNGKPHQVSVSVVVDGKNVAWETDPGAFLFAAQEQIKRSMQDFAADMAKATEDAISRTDAVAEGLNASMAAQSPEVKKLTDRWLTLEDACRGGHGGEPATVAACADRDAIYSEIRAKGWCWGRANDPSYQRKWVPCAPGDA